MTFHNKTGLLISHKCGSMERFLFSEKHRNMQICRFIPVYSSSPEEELFSKIAAEQSQHQMFKLRNVIIR